MRRRQFIRVMSGAATTAAVSHALGLDGLAHDWFQDTPSAAPILNRGFATVTKIADGVYATIADASKGDQAFSNGGIIVGRDAVLIVEGHHKPEGAALEVEAAKMVSKAPVRAAVDTHYHFDHTFGNVYYEQQKIPILAHERTASMMKTAYADPKVKDPTGTTFLAPFEAQVRSASDAVSRQRAEGDLGLAKRVISSVQTTTLAYPTETVGATGKKIDLGGLTVVIDARPGHTPTDIVITVPERDVLFAGDLLFNGLYPVTFDANMTAWRRVLDGFAKLGPRFRFVPGHGPLASVKEVRLEADVLDDLRAHAEAMMKAGVSVEEAANRYKVPDRFASLVILAWGFTIGSAIQKYYTELRKAA